jgi:hypothetical protein
VKSALRHSQRRGRAESAACCKQSARATRSGCAACCALADQVRRHLRCPGRRRRGERRAPPVGQHQGRRVRGAHHARHQRHGDADPRRGVDREPHRGSGERAKRGRWRRPNTPNAPAAALLSGGVDSPTHQRNLQSSRGVAFSADAPPVHGEVQLPRQRPNPFSEYRFGMILTSTRRSGAGTAAQAGSARSAIAAQAITSSCAPDGLLSEAGASYAARDRRTGPIA